MEKRVKVLVSIITIVVLVALFYLITSTISKLTGFSITGKTVTDEKKESFAKCLTEKGIIMYGSFTCIHCIEQKDKFGKAFKFVNYVECSENVEKCIDLRGVPAWKINKEIYYGTKSLQELSKLSGCEL